MAGGRSAERGHQLQRLYAPQAQDRGVPPATESGGEAMSTTEYYVIGIVLGVIAAKIWDYLRD